MATYTLTTSPTTIDSGSSYAVLVVNQGPAVVEVRCNGVVQRLRPAQNQTVETAGNAVTALVVDGGTTATAVTTTLAAPTSSTGSVGTVQIADGGVNTVDIAAGAVTAAKLAGDVAPTIAADPALTGTYAPFTSARFTAQGATYGYVNGRAPRARTRHINVTNGTTGSVAFVGLSPVGTFTCSTKYLLVFTARDNSTGVKYGADWPIMIGRESGNASVQSGTVANWKGTEFGTSATNIVVSATTATNGSSLTVSIQNTTANIRQFDVQLFYFTPSSTDILDGFACWGDSLTLGGASPYPTQLGNLAGLTCTNLGVGGEDSTRIAARANAVISTLTAPATIPTTTSAVTINTNYDAPGVGFASTTPVSIAGIAGSLSRSSGLLAFTRAAEGGATTVPAGTPVFFTTADAMASKIQVIWIGTNDAAVDYIDVVNNCRAIANTSRTGQSIVLSAMIDSAYPTGTARHTALVALNSALSATFGTQYLDIRSYLITGGLTDAGLTPTSQDTTDIANDIVPTQLRIDSLHLTTAGYGVVAAQVYAKAQALGYAG